MKLHDEVNKAVDDLFGKYTVKSPKLAQEREEIPLANDRKHQTSALDKGEIEQIKELTAGMLRRLNLAVKSDSWGHRLYYSYQFLQIAMRISNRITKRK